MRIDTIATVNEARADDFPGRTAIVIDVLRATSNMATALAHGAAGIVTAETVQAARSLQQPGDLLGGERNCVRIAGFDLGNSPFEYAANDVRGRRIVMTTTNGTRALHKSLKAQHVLAGCLLNAGACADAALALRKDVVLVCAGTQDAFALEDGLGAGAIIASLLERRDSRLPVALNDCSLALLHAFERTQGRLHETLASGQTGIRLAKLGFADDIAYCARLNVLSVCPVVKGKTLVGSEPAACTEAR